MTSLYEKRRPKMTSREEYYVAMSALLSKSKAAQKKLFHAVWEKVGNEPNLYYYRESQLDILEYAFRNPEESVYLFGNKGARQAADACIEVLYERYNQPKPGIPPVGLTFTSMYVLHSMLDYFIKKRNYTYIKKIEKVVDDIPFASKIECDGKIIATRWTEEQEEKGYSQYYEKIKAKSWYYLNQCTVSLNLSEIKSARLAIRKELEEERKKLQRNKEQDNHERTVHKTSNTQSLQEKLERNLLDGEYDRNIQMLEEKHKRDMQKLEEEHKRNMQMLDEKYGRNM